MNQFLKLTKTKIKIALYFFILYFLFFTPFSIFERILISSASEEELFFLIQYVLPILLIVSITLKFYLYACLAIYFVSKEKKGTIFIFKNINQFFNLTKTKIKIVLCFYILSFLFCLPDLIFQRMFISSAGKEELFYILSILSLILTALEFYFYACFAIYFINRGKEQKKESSFVG